MIWKSEVIDNKCMLIIFMILLTEIYKSYIKSNSWNMYYVNNWSVSKNKSIKQRTAAKYIKKKSVRGSSHYFCPRLIKILFKEIKKKMFAFYLLAIEDLYVW
jgi:hypothetical protein